MTMTLDELEAATERAAAAYMSGTANIAALNAQMLAMLHAATEYERGSTARDAQHVMAWQCAFLGALAAARGNILMAKGYAATVRSYGERAGDAQAVARAHIAAAQVECWPGGDPAKAVALAAEGLHRTSPTQREQYARLCAILMEAEAQRGNRQGFDEAHTLARQAHAYLDAKPSTLFGYSAQQMYQALANAFADFGDRSAVDYAEMSIIRHPRDTPLVRMLVEYPRAYALAKTGSPDAAVEAALAASTSTSTSTAWFHKDRSRRVLDALPEGYDSPRKRYLEEFVTAS